MKDSIQFCKKYPTFLGERSTTVVFRKAVVYRYFSYSCPHPRMRIVKSFLVQTYVFVDLKLFKTKKLAPNFRIISRLPTTQKSRQRMWQVVLSICNLFIEFNHVSSCPLCP